MVRTHHLTALGLVEREQGVLDSRAFADVVGVAVVELPLADAAAGELDGGLVAHRGWRGCQIEKERDSRLAV